MGFVQRPAWCAAKSVVVRSRSAQLLIHTNRSTLAPVVVIHAILKWRISPPHPCLAHWSSLGSRLREGKSLTPHAVLIFSGFLNLLLVPDFDICASFAALNCSTQRREDPISPGWFKCGVA